MSTSENSPVQPYRRLRIFLCHSSGDKEIVRNLYHRLKEDGFVSWLDENELLPGQEWREEITSAVRASDVVLVCISRKSINKEGYLQREIREALFVADEKPEGMIFIIPVRIEPVEVPRRLSNLQRADLYKENGYNLLIRALQNRASTLNIPLDDFTTGKTTPKELEPDSNLLSVNDRSVLPQKPQHESHRLVGIIKFAEFVSRTSRRRKWFFTLSFVVIFFYIIFFIRAYLGKSSQQVGAGSIPTKQPQITEPQKQDSPKEERAVSGEKELSPSPQPSPSSTAGHLPKIKEADTKEPEQLTDNAQQPRPSAALLRAQQYLQGRGVPKSCEQGLLYLQAATGKGDPGADIQMAALYSSGYCVKQDRVMAYRWFNSAHELEPNNGWIQKNLDQLWAQMTPQERRLAGY